MRAHQLWQGLGDLLWPRRCVNCRLLGDYLCADCLTLLPPAAMPELEHAVALFDYDDPRVKRLVWQLKYHGVTSIASTFGPLLYQELLDELADWQSLHPDPTPWLVIPIPLSRERRRERGYNQAELLARALVRTAPEILKLETGILVKTKNTASQVSLRSREARLKNLAGAFAVAPARPSGGAKGQKIILVDDVMTTGGTMHAARAALRRAGATAVLAAAVAHG